MADNLIFLAHRREESKTEVTEHMACKHCRNKTWIVTWTGESELARMQCAVCGIYAGHIGWVDDKE